MVAEIVAACSAVLLALATTLAGLASPGYSAIRDSLSKLGAPGQPYAAAINYAVFLPVGLACLWLAWQPHPHAGYVLLASALAVGYLGAVCWPLDPQRPWRYRLHLLCGASEYLAALVALLLLLPSPLPWIIPVIAWPAAAAMLLPGQRSSQGLWQRLLESMLFAALLIAA